jgi:hypothetical protein
VTLTPENHRSDDVVINISVLTTDYITVNVISGGGAEDVILSINYLGT